MRHPITIFSFTYINEGEKPSYKWISDDNGEEYPEYRIPHPELPLGKKSLEEAIVWTNQLKGPADRALQEVQQAIKVLEDQIKELAPIQSRLHRKVLSFKDSLECLNYKLKEVN